jgi:hypothetical protein
VIGSTVSHYRILGKLGQGGMGVVFRATDTRLERQVALKMLPPEATARGDLKLRILREARAAAALHHPNVCAVYDIAQACFDLARACAVPDRRSEAVGWLRNAVDAGWGDREFLAHDESMVAIGGAPEFAGLIQSIESE